MSMNYELAKELKDAGYPQKEARTVQKGITPSGNRGPYYCKAQIKKGEVNVCACYGEIYKKKKI